MRPIKKTRWFLAVLLIPGLLLSGCSSSDDDPSATATYRVTVMNITNNQPLSPVGLVLHMAGYSPWTMGGVASSGLEILAEGGDPSAFLGEADANTAVLKTAAGSGVILPGGSESVEITATGPTGDWYLSFATMLVNTNDAFTGAGAKLVSTLEMDGEMVLFTNALGAGTEKNTETAASVPGPAAGGEGFNAARDDKDFVTVHPGVVTADDGLSTSALNASHRWDNPVAKVVVTRIN